MVVFFLRRRPGAVHPRALRKGEYNDALTVKRNEECLLLQENQAGLTLNFSLEVAQVY